MTTRDEEVLEAIKVALTGLPTTGHNVERDRFWPAENTPALSIEMGPEEPLGEFGQMNQQIYDEQLTVDVVIHVKTIDGLSTQLNKILGEIWPKLLTSGLGLAYAEQIYYAGRDKPENAEIADQPVTMQATHWIVHYRHSTTDRGQ